MISMRDVFAQGIIGGVAGAAQGAYTSALEDQKRQSEAIREQRLSQLRMQEHSTNTQSDLAAKKTAADAQAKETGDFYAKNKLPARGIIDQARADYESDDGTPESSTSSTVTTAVPASRKDQADAYSSAAKLTGRPDLMKQTYDESKDIRADDDAQRRTTAEERKAKALEQTAGHQQRQDDSRDESNRIRDRQVDAMVERLNNPDGKTPAKVKEVNWLAENVFDGDVKKAVQFAYGTADKDRGTRITQVAKIIKDSPDAAQLDSADLMKKAGSIVDGFESIEGPRRGGVSATTGATGPKPMVAPKGTMDAPERPMSARDVDALPTGSIYVNPADNKKYRKK